MSIDTDPPPLTPPPEPLVFSHQGAARVARNSVFSILARFIDLVMRFVVIAVIAQYLGRIRYGDFAFVTAAAMFVHVLADFGVEPIMVREMSGAPAKRREIFGTAAMLRLVFSLLLLLSVGVLALFSPLSPAVGTALVIESAAQLFIAFQIILLGVFRVVEHLEYDLGACALHQVLMIGLVGAAVMLKLDIVWIFAARAAAEAAKLLFQATVIHRRFMKLRLAWAPRRSRFLLKEALPVIALSFLTVATLRVNVFILKYFRPPEEISFFDIPQRIALAINMVPLMIVMTVFPVLCRKARATSALFGYAYVKTLKFLFLLSLPLSVVLIVWSEGIIATVFGPEYLPCIGVLQIVGASLWATFLIPLMNFVLTSVGKQTKTLWGVSGGLVLNLVVAFATVPRWGYLGAAAALAGGNVVYLAINIWLVSRHADVRPKASVMVKPALAALAMFLTASAWPGSGLLSMAAGGAVSLLVFGVVLLALRTLSREELQIFAGIVRKGQPPERRPPGSSGQEA